MEFLKNKSLLLKYSAIALAMMTLLASILFFVIWPDNLMHSDMAAEVILSKLLAEEGGLVSANWYYSTELRVIYTQLLMTPLFKVFADYGTVKLLSLIIYDVLLAVVFYFTAKEFELKGAPMYLAMALLLTPLSNEYFDMMLIGNFYTSQAICTFLVLNFFFRREKKDVVLPKKIQEETTAKTKETATIKEEVLYRNKKYLRLGLLALFAFILGLSGLRYLASLYVPLLAAICISYAFDTKEERAEGLLCKGLTSVCLLIFAGIGFWVNKFYLAFNYTFDSQAVEFLPLSEVPERLLTSVKLMLEFCGYRQVPVMTPLGIVNAVKFAFFLFLIYVVVYLIKHRYEILEYKQRLLLYYFLALFFINWYMLVFTNVLPQYRYWLPIYIIAVLLVGIYIAKAKERTECLKPVWVTLAVITVFASLYGEVWQAAKYNDCEKRYGYMEFLEDEGYRFGYATFWNSSVTEYLSNGTIEVGHLGGDENGSAPYEWLSPKYYYEEGYHEGKTFLLLAKTEEPALFNGDITIMQDATKVYEDEFYVIYEGEGMYLFSEGD